MIILAIETSCDESALSIVEAKGGFKDPHFKILAHVVSSQVALHAPWGGVVPNLAKREHEKNLVPLLLQTLKKAKRLKKNLLGKIIPLPKKRVNALTKLLDHEPELLKQFLEIIPQIKTPPIDAIAVTQGPGLEPALWVGINFAKALSAIWDKPLLPINHLEGHILSSLGSEAAKVKLHFPAIALLVSGGHTELVLVKNWLDYKIVGRTRDDAVGEAFDKVARILGLPYPGGPEISKLAQEAENLSGETDPSLHLPRPMLNSGDLDFSFSGLKTAVLYKVKELTVQKELSNELKALIAKEFQEAAVEVIVKKTVAAVKQYRARALIVGGGVIANKKLRDDLKEAVKKNCSGTTLLIPHLSLTTDNATMIALAAYFRALDRRGKNTRRINIRADGNLSLG